MVPDLSFLNKNTSLGSAAPDVSGMDLNVGDKVMAKVYDAEAGLVPGDMGVVDALRPNGGIYVRFVSLLPTKNLLPMYWDQLEDEITYLRRQGVRKGQTVYSTISWKSGSVNLVPGSLGTVVGAPDSNNNGEERVLVRFGISGNLNVLPSQISINDPSVTAVSDMYNQYLTLMGADAGASSAVSSRAAVASRPAAALQLDSLATSDMSLISHTHGRERRRERNIQRRELQEAIKYGRRELAHPGRNGARRWKYTHRDVVYITDEFSRHEITSWRLDVSGVDDDHVLGNADVLGGGPTGSHTVIVVDHSGSMRKNDVRGFKTRTAAVYDCVAKEFVQKQLDNPRENDGGSVVTLIEMSNTAQVTLHRHPLDEALLEAIKQRKHSRARSHGNYLSALDAVERVLEPEMTRTSHVYVIFLSDGAPSDHTQMECTHGVQVWQEDPSGATNAKGKPKLNKCKNAWRCRKVLQKSVEDECVDRIARLGKRLSRERLFLATVAFGPLDDDYSVLDRMAKALPRSEFQKLGLSAQGLSSALTSFSSTLTTLRTGCSTGSLTERKKEKISADDAKRAAKTIPSQLGDSSEIVDPAQWALYALPGSNLIKSPQFRNQYSSFGRALVKKQRWDSRQNCWVQADLLPRSEGLAYMLKYFASGAERLCYRCCEVDTYGRINSPPFVAKESKHCEFVNQKKFHDNFARTQGEAQSLAVKFNDRLDDLLYPKFKGGRWWPVFFVPCFLYSLEDWDFMSTVWVLVEQELDGKYTKWNNNGGGVYKKKQRGVDAAAVQPSAVSAGPTIAPVYRGGLLAITEEEEEEEEEEDPRGESGGGGVGDEYDLVDDVPQCFSHFTYSITNGKKLVCDIQGVWNVYDGFTLTDPVIHYRSSNRRHVNGATDKGKAGMGRFFKTHKCGPLCQKLGLSMPDLTIFDD